MNKFSIILPVRNGGEYVKQCVQSILNQTLPDFQLHVLENCSTDGTAEWIQSLSDDRIIFYPAEKPLSIEENWGRIIHIKKNEFMTLIGHDDLLHPHYLQEMEELIHRHPKASLYQSHYSYIDKDGHFVRWCLPMDEVQYAHEFLACHMTRTMDSMGSGNMMRSRDYDEVGGMPLDYPNLIFADYELWINITALGYKATALRNCFSYRVHLSVSRITNGMLYQEAFGKYVDYISHLKQKNMAVKEVVDRYGRDMLLYFCESLSHRLLKTPLSERSLSVAEFIKKCESYAAQLIPGQHFQPLKKFRIRIAKQFDQSNFGRVVFRLYKRWS